MNWDGDAFPPGDLVTIGLLSSLTSASRYLSALTIYTSHFWSDRTWQNGHAHLPLVLIASRDAPSDRHGTPTETPARRRDRNQYTRITFSAHQPPEKEATNPNRRGLAMAIDLDPRCTRSAEP